MAHARGVPSRQTLGQCCSTAVLPVHHGLVKPAATSEVFACRILQGRAWFKLQSSLFAWWTFSLPLFSVLCLSDLAFEVWRYPPYSA
eukprot:2013073-Rhodomonas_salina.1